jgi:hypothetical protein
MGDGSMILGGSIESAQTTYESGCGGQPVESYYSWSSIWITAALDCCDGSNQKLLRPENPGEAVLLNQLDTKGIQRGITKRRKKRLPEPVWGQVSDQPGPLLCGFRRSDVLVEIRQWSSRWIILGWTEP